MDYVGTSDPLNALSELAGAFRALAYAVRGGGKRKACRTPKFAESLEELIQLANQGRIALMCAEAVPWRCHRSLIADALTVRGIRTEDIMSQLAVRLTLLRPLPKVRGTTVTYPADDSQIPHKKSSPKRGSVAAHRNRMIE